MLALGARIISNECALHLRTIAGRNAVPVRAQANQHNVESAPARRNILVLGTAGVIASG